nr:immunoglobulin light chain junction region [Macaca mulatta]MOV65925.1 immunoglobulin light chain junction region [Macaca mulatta]MOV65937.1 immunoglobulin light chain junction region [Macaca mulatta]MOV65965.1 immunoglobulin light chain junction region [Macaca mulatta]MOV66305.1 immunoglobulin light chain junction region [Macaca mulatta]
EYYCLLYYSGAQLLF